VKELREKRRGEVLIVDLEVSETWMDERQILVLEFRARTRTSLIS
jgi:hypothetical protein